MQWQERGKEGGKRSCLTDQVEAKARECPKNSECVTLYVNSAQPRVCIVSEKGGERETMCDYVQFVYVLLSVCLRARARTTTRRDPKI
jgi:hypothetical protein